MCAVQVLVHNSVDRGGCVVATLGPVACPGQFSLRGVPALKFCFVLLCETSWPALSAVQGSRRRFCGKRAIVRVVLWSVHSLNTYVIQTTITEFWTVFALVVM